MSKGLPDKLIATRRLFTGLEHHLDFGIEIFGDTLGFITKHNNFNLGAADANLPKGVVVTAGFIDTQVNGGGGVLLNDAPTLATIRTMAAAHRRHGTTGMLPTLITDTPDKMQALLAIAPEALKIPGVLGFHLEGPFINPMRTGVHREDMIRAPTDADMAMLKAFGRMGRSVVTLAPELFTTAQLKALVASGLIVSAGHTVATYEQMREAADAGVRGVTHLFNAMSQMTARAPGVVGAALDDKRLYAGLIADGHHVAASNMRIALRQKTRAGLMLVTDAMPTAASKATSFALQGRQISLKGDRLSTADGTLAGAHLTMIEAVQRFAAATSDNDWTDAVIAATLTPAHFLGLDETHGLVITGRKADLVAFHAETFEVYDTWIGGVASDDGWVARQMGNQR